MQFDIFQLTEKESGEFPEFRAYTLRKTLRASCRFPTASKNFGLSGNVKRHRPLKRLGMAVVIARIRQVLNGPPTQVRLHGCGRITHAKAGGKKKGLKRTKSNAWSIFCNLRRKNICV